MSERRALKPGMTLDKLSALDQLTQEMQTGRRIKKKEQESESEMEVEDYENIDEMKDFIEGEMAYDDDYYSEEESDKKKSKKVMPAKPKNTLLNYTKQKKPPTKPASMAPKKTVMEEQKSKAMLDSLMALYDTSEPIEEETLKTDAKFLYKSKEEKEKDNYDISLKELNSKKRKRSESKLQEAEEKENRVEIEEDTFGDLDEIDKMVNEQREEQKVMRKGPEKPFIPFYCEDKEFIGASNGKDSYRGIVKCSDVVTEDNNLNFYWIDAFEDTQGNPGKVFLFGKVMNKRNSTFHNCTVEVPNILRKLYFVPNYDDHDLNEEELMEKLQEELEELRKLKFNKGNFEWRTRVSELDYAFELDIPTGKRKYLEVHYSFSFPQLVSNISGKYFKGIIGTSYSALEIFLIQQEIKGPRWLSVQNAKQTKSYNPNAISFIVENMKAVNPSKENFADPPLNVLSVAICASKLSVSKENEIIAIGCMFTQNFPVSEENFNKSQSSSTFSIVRETMKNPLNMQNTFNVKGEFELLEYFIKKVAQLDPDVIVSHDIYSNLFDLLLSRMQKNRIKTASHISRLPGRDYLREKGINRIRSITVGRLLADSYLSSRDVVRESNYSLTHLSKKYLDKERMEMDSESVKEIFNGGLVDKMKEIIHSVTYEAFLSFKIIQNFQILPLTLQLTQIAGNLWIRSLQNSRAERNELMLMHEFHKKGFILPDKNVSKMDDKLIIDGEDRVIKRKQKAKYLGGLVLEPKAGFYESIILLLDFNSLYPSIIQEFNLCFTTVERPKTPMNSNVQPNEEKEEGEEGIITDGAPGILPSIIKSLVDRRKLVKGLIRNEKNPQKLATLDIRQKAIKLTANSIYGCLGFSNSRFYAQPIAALITKKGREILEKSVKHVNDVMGHEVVYGDTDSMMVNSNVSHLGDAIKVGLQIKKEINKHYKCLEIEIDGVFKPLLLLRKKKYAAKKLENLADLMSGSTTEPKFSQEVKGIDLVRRDWCELSKKIGKTILDEILSGKPKEEIIGAITDHLSELNSQIANNEVNLREFILTKQLTKNPNEYPDAKSLPHVEVAKRMRELGLSSEANVGHFIHYIICKGIEKKLSLAQRAFHPKEFAEKKGELELDIEYYKTQQVMPPITRLCGYLESAALSQFAQALGIDPSKFSSIANEEENIEDELQNIADEGFEELKLPHDIFNLKLHCLTCKLEKEFFHPFFKRGAKFIEAVSNGCGLYCENCGNEFLAPFLINKFTMILKENVWKYYNGMVRCEDESCMVQSRQITTTAKKCSRMDCRSNYIMIYSNRRIYQNLRYLHTFLKKYHAAYTKNPIKQEALSITINKLKGLLDQFKVNLNSLFSFMSVKNK